MPVRARTEWRAPERMKGEIMPDDLHYLSLDEVARRLKARKLSSVEATQAMLDRIGKLDPKLKSYATLTPERALADASAPRCRNRGRQVARPAARRADRGQGSLQHRRRADGRRHGDPSRPRAGQGRDGGDAAEAGGRGDPGQAADDRRRLRRCIIRRSIRRSIPCNAAYWTGVSSSGSGVATAAGLCFASLGSDTGGSIRFPSTMNGLSGLKPTWGRVSRAGVFPLAESLDHVGPMCRSALDAAIVLGVIAGADPDDPTAAPQPVPDYAAAIGAGVKGKRIGRAQKPDRRGCRLPARARRRDRRRCRGTARSWSTSCCRELDEAALRLAGAVRRRGGLGA